MADFIKFLINNVNDYIINFENIKMDHQNSEFDNIKNELNAVKSLLDDIPERDYLLISQNLDSYKTIKQVINYRYKMQVITNATLKIYEIITQMKLINTNTLTLFCNAELPGNFIIGINHYIKTMYKNSIFRWVASSYLSDAGTLGDSYGIFEHNRNNWLMDRTMDGNLMNKENIIELTKRVLKRFPKGVDLYTSDAGFDVSNDYNKQEEQTILLNYGQILSGLLTLSIGGSLITKQFTYFTPFNKSLIILLSTLFDQLYITKPVTSRPLNSEIYLVGIKYKGISDKLKTFLIDKMDTLNYEIPLILYEPNNDLLLSAKYIYNIQINYINYAYGLYKNNEYIDPKEHKKYQDMWLLKNPIYTINKRDYIPYNKKY
jgi:hypothetical protein